MHLDAGARELARVIEDTSGYSRLISRLTAFEVPTRINASKLLDLAHLLLPVVHAGGRRRRPWRTMSLPAR